MQKLGGIVAQNTLGDEENQFGDNIAGRNLGQKLGEKYGENCFSARS